MPLDILTQELLLREPFRTSRGVRDRTKNVFVRLRADGFEGYGEAAPMPRFDQTVQTVCDALREIAARLETADDSAGPVQAALGACRDASARASVDVAFHDWLCKKQELTLAEFWDLKPRPIPIMLTLGIEDPGQMVERAVAAEQFSGFKLKVGDGQDRERIEAVHRETQKPLRVDANEGWEDPEQALAEIEWMADHGVEWVEQPLPAGRLEDVDWLHQRSPLPLIADEDCVDIETFPQLAQVYDGVNLKLDKIGGLARCRRAAQEARRLGLRVLVGCAMSSSLSVTAAAHLALEADGSDLDAHLFLDEDPFVGVRLEQGALVLNKEPGIGAQPRPD